MSEDAIFNRRLLLGAGAAALAAPALLGATRAAAQQAGAQEARPFVFPPDIHRFKVGGFEVTVIKDGAREAGAPNETFGIDQAPDEVARLLTDNFLPPNTFVNGFSPVLVNTGSDVVLFDTGFGESGREWGGGRLVEGMALAGYQPEDVTVVVLTHLHGDHIGGMTENGEATFPNARYVTGQVEYDFWVNPERVGTPAEAGHQGVLAKVQPFAEKFTFLDDGGEVVSGIGAMAAFGHSPGHMIYRLESDGKQLILTADTANHYVLSLQRPDWEVRFDMDKAAAAETRKKVFDMIATDRLAFLGYHMPFPAAGYVEKQDTGYRFIAKSYQFDV
ncbi:MBL fold metallo-hydrolase [Rhizobiaceae bacterium BDR2-2]|uniref:MBL fold metallo-hydrolase n=1 Tax=Ectorhizobium quercum TaxID=2965071 RepID=A0AAE3N0V8_9HYPH|nr:MBL fold metallo-hydrolase [Ectorhizobium quercum]MCX8996263.1 MBL fold metallo-hydrolase [Ectorhizobium quercum]MCX8998698.1 MBL fold metallo-hydrolase [Ectorhizobium quercum]